MGIIMMNHRSFVNGNTERKCPIENKPETEMITLVQFKLALIVFVVGYAISFVSFLREMRRSIIERLINMLRHLSEDNSSLNIE